MHWIRDLFPSFCLCTLYRKLLITLMIPSAVPLRPQVLSQQLSSGSKSCGALLHLTHMPSNSPFPLRLDGMGCVSWTKSTPSRKPVQTPTSPTRTAPKPSYSQVAIRRPPEPAIKPGQRPATKENLWPHDPVKSPPCDLAHDSSRDLRALKQACDLIARDRGNLTHDLPRDWSSTRSPDHARFLHASRPLINTWKTVGTINSWLRINEVTRLTAELQHSPQFIYY